LGRVATMIARDTGVSSRIVYAAGLVDIDDARVWSIAPGRDLEQRLYRIRRGLTRVAWNGTRPIVSEVANVWRGRGDAIEHDLERNQIERVRSAALAMLTSQTFDDGEHPLVLDPTVVASVIDATVRMLMTSTAVRRPEVARRLAIGAAVASPLLTLVDDPT